MPIERNPSRPLPSTFVPPGGVRYSVKDGDSWESVASSNGLDVRTLVFFNYYTNNPDEVNWYLRRNAGCQKLSRDGKNWAFSSSAKPGIIYLYPRSISFDAEEITPGAKTIWLSF